MTDADLVWYVAYGSSLLRERFLRYIEGGTFHGIEHRGCADPTPPRDEFGLVLPYERYFAHHSPQWGGGVAFLDVYTRGETVARAYGITQGQFNDLFAQENGWPDRQPRPEGWYRMTLKLGEEEGLPMFTLTATDRAPSRKPGAEYLDVIRRGEAEVDALP